MGVAGITLGITGIALNYSSVKKLLSFSSSSRNETDSLSQNVTITEGGSGSAVSNGKIPVVVKVKADTPVIDPSASPTHEQIGNNSKGQLQAKAAGNGINDTRHNQNKNEKVVSRLNLHASGLRQSVITKSEASVTKATPDNTAAVAKSHNKKQCVFTL